MCGTFVTAVVTPNYILSLSRELPLFNDSFLIQPRNPEQREILRIPAFKVNDKRGFDFIKKWNYIDEQVRILFLTGWNKEGYDFELVFLNTTTF